MDKLFFSLILSVSYFGICAQETWMDYYQDSKIKIQYQYSDCHNVQQGTHKQYVLLRFQNNTTETVSVSFSKELWYDNKCSGCDNSNPENNYHISLSAKETRAGNCDTKDKSLNIFSKMLDMEKSELTKFELKNVTVK